MKSAREYVHELQTLSNAIFKRPGRKPKGDEAHRLVMLKFAIAELSEEQLRSATKPDLIYCFVILQDLYRSNSEWSENTDELLWHELQKSAKDKRAKSAGAKKTNAKWIPFREKVKPHWEKWHAGKMSEHRSQAAFARWAAREVCCDEITPRRIEGWSKQWREENEKSRRR